MDPNETLRASHELLNAEGEVVVQLANGWTLRSGSDSKSGFISGDYVRLCRPDGSESLFWSSDEWRDDPVLVMGAIMNAAAGFRSGSTTAG